MELKWSTVIRYGLLIRSFNRTAYGIEIDYVLDVKTVSGKSF